MAKRQFALPPLRRERQGGPPPPDYLWRYKQKFRRDRRARRVHTEASCASVATEHLLHLFIGRQVSPGGTLFDNLPLFIGDSVAQAPLLDLAHEPRNLLLIVGRPTQHAIEDFFDLIFCHDPLYHVRP